MLLIGYGNPGRGDDGLGPAFAERIERARLPGVEVSIDYQLTVDHVLPERVVVADAEIGLDAPFRLRPLAPAATGTLTSHCLSPGEVLALARLLYGRAPETHVLGIAGTEFGEIREGLSARANRPQATSDVAESLGLHPNTVRPHLDRTPSTEGDQQIRGS